MKSLEISSPVFKAGQVIPAKYTCQGMDINPPIHIGKIPYEAKSLVIKVDDPDAPNKTWLHWLVWDVVPKESIEEDIIPGIQGMNDFNRINYGGPCPPSGIHRYFFKVYALDKLLGLAEGASLNEINEAMKGHIIAFGELIGNYAMAK
ncbi:YbhB/YbcL family Raf kinase inhibitor-like protein [Echinicola shivajiensis]|uniref:YbhB/YbcL family Raf kinase inhibitor-like protein n=1 Tax=Echinicola shivajiensis TaxID=1035916 RepID=UPI001BFC28AA|nr:YbhB/YbcL family Raf kinase inhibitor-like protein [Echinicola shivajiensis]